MERPHGGQVVEVLYAEDQFEIEICGVYLNRHLYDTAACSIFLMDKIDWTAYLLIRGFAGLSGILFVLLVGVLVYRVNAAYYKDRDKSPFNE